MSALRVEQFLDEEAGNWHYRVPALHINGGGTPTREDAGRECLSAIAFALEGDPRDYDTDRHPWIPAPGCGRSGRSEGLSAHRGGW